MTQIHYK